MGACLQGGVLSGSVKGLLLLDVTPLSLGIETLGGVCTRVIERNTTLPIRKSQIFTTASNFQSSVDVHVLQGERPMARQNKELGRFQLTGIRRAPRGVPQIEVTFSIDANGIVNVSAKDLDTGKAQAITITATSNMSREEIDRAVRDAQQYAAEDEKLKAEAVAKDRCEHLLYKAASVKPAGQGAEGGNCRGGQSCQARHQIPRQRADGLRRGPIGVVTPAGGREHGRHGQLSRALMKTPTMPSRMTPWTRTSNPLDN